MIRRVGDYSTLPNDSLSKIAKVIEKNNNKKLYKTCNSENELSVATKEIKLQGYKAKVEKLGDKYNVYSVLPETVDLKNAEQSGQFKKLAWGRYSFQKVNSINGFEKLNYDDGSIWKVITDKDGKEYLVKEVDDEDEDIVIRTKTANLEKQSDTISNNNFVDDENFRSVMQILYNNSSMLNNDFMNELLNISEVKQAIYNLLENKMNILLVEKLQQQNVSDQNVTQQILQRIQKSIDDNEVVDENTLESVIYNSIAEIMRGSTPSL